jgi:transcriptional regulator of acetoin/glycerol metabolism
MTLDGKMDDLDSLSRSVKRRGIEPDHRQLEQKISEGGKREPLYYTLPVA